MASKSHDHSSKQVTLAAEKTLQEVSHPKSSSASYNASEVTLRDITVSMENKNRDATLGGESTGSSSEANSSSINEEDLMKSFENLTKGLIDENLSGEGKQCVSNKACSLSRSEGRDSLDEEVSRIMFKDKKRGWERKWGGHSDLVESSEKGTEEEETEQEEEDGEEEEEEVNTETESDDYYDNDSDVSLTEDHEDTTSSEEEGEFNLDEYLDRLINAETEYDSDTSLASSAYSDPETNQAIRKLIYKYKRQSLSLQKTGLSESESSDDSEDEPYSKPEGKPKEDDVKAKESENESDKTEVESDSSTYSSLSATCSELDFSDEESISSESSLSDSRDGILHLENGDDYDPEIARLFSESPTGHAYEPDVDPRDIIYTYYLADSNLEKPSMIELQDEEIGNSTNLDATLGPRSVMNLRWPFSSFYVKEIEGKESESPDPPSHKDDDLLPSYKSFQSSVSFPGRRRNVMLGRVWWVEWWAKDSVDSASGNDSWDMRP